MLWVRLQNQDCRGFNLDCYEGKGLIKLVELLKEWNTRFLHG